MVGRERERAKVREGRVRRRKGVGRGFCVEMAGVLKREGYIADFYAEKLESGLQELKVQLKASGRDRAIVGIRRVSRPGLRVYKNAKELPRVLGGMGISIVTTSRGIMAGHEARKQNIGGEVLAYVW